MYSLKDGRAETRHKLAPEYGPVPLNDNNSNARRLTKSSVFARRCFIEFRPWSDGLLARTSSFHAVLASAI